MGANNFENRIAAGTALEAWRELGGGTARDVYAGDITCKTDFRIETPLPGETPLQCVERCRKDRSHFSDDKWGDAACVDLGPSPKSSELRIFCFFGWAPS